MRLILLAMALCAALSAQEVVNIEDWKRDHIEVPLQTLAASQGQQGAWPEDESPTGTSLRILCFLGAGYDHKMPNKHRRTLQRALDRLRQHDPAKVTVPERAWIALVYAEALGMSGDPALRQPGKAAVAALEAGRRVEGGWAAVAGGPLDWPTTGVALMALRSAIAAELRQPQPQDAVWWGDAAGDGTDDDIKTLAWKVASGVALRPATLDHTRRLGRVLLARAVDLRLNDTHCWLLGEIAYQMGRESWLAWEARMRAIPVTTQFSPMRLLADERLYLYAAKE